MSKSLLKQQKEFKNLNTKHNFHNSIDNIGKTINTKEKPIKYVISRKVQVFR